MLREKLSKVHAWDWLKAQCIFSEICRLCEVVGPKGALMTPRACRYCKYYGHSRQFCPVLKQDEEGEYERMIYRYVPVEEHEVEPEQWKQISEMRRLNKRYKEAIAGGLRGCTVGGPCLKCAGCEEWEEFMQRTVP